MNDSAKYCEGKDETGYVRCFGSEIGDEMEKCTITCFYNRGTFCIMGQQVGRDRTSIAIAPEIK